MYQLQLHTQGQSSVLPLPSEQSLRLPAQAGTQYTLYDAHGEPMQAQLRVNGKDLQIYVPGQEEPLLTLVDFFHDLPAAPVWHAANGESVVGALADQAPLAGSARAAFFQSPTATQVLPLPKEQPARLSMPLNTAQSPVAVSPAPQDPTSPKDSPKEPSPPADTPIEQPKDEPADPPKDDPTEPAPEQPSPEEPPADPPSPEEPPADPPAPEDPPADPPSPEEPPADPPSPEEPPADPPTPEDPPADPPSPEEPPADPPAPEEPPADPPAPEEPPADSPEPENPPPSDNPEEPSPPADTPVEQPKDEPADPPKDEPETPAPEQPAPEDPSTPEEPPVPPEAPLPPVSGPDIRLDPIAEDGIINAVESRQPTLRLTGVVVNPDSEALAKPGDSILIRVGQAEYRPTLAQDLRFSIDVETLTLMQHKHMTATFVGQNQAGRAVQSEAQASVEVVTDLPKPVITLGNFATDNLVQRLEAEGELTMTGSVSDGFEGQYVRIRCGCPTCTGNQWHEVTAPIRNGQFTVTFNGADVIRALGDSTEGEIQVDYTAEDHAQNQSPAETARRSFRYDGQQNDVNVNFSTVTDDNIINQAESRNQTIFIRAEVQHQPGYKIDSVTLKIGDFTHGLRAGRQAGAYVNSIPTKAFLDRPNEPLLAVVKYTTQNGLKGEVVSAVDTASRPGVVKVDLDPPTFTVNVNPLATLSERSPEVTTLSGTIAGDDTHGVVSDSLRVQVRIGEQSFNTTLDASTGQWQVQLPTEMLTYDQGQLPYTVVVIGRDGAGNEGRHEQEFHYEVDTRPPQVRIEGLQLGEHNSISTTPAVGADDTTTITGRVTGEYRAGEMVTLSIYNHGRPLGLARIEADGQFSLSVENARLRSAPWQVLAASYVTTDAVGNMGDTHTIQGYSKTQGDLRLFLDPIANDNLINITEAKTTLSATGVAEPLLFTISGRVEGALASGASQVNLRLGDHTVTAQVDQGRFSSQVTLEQLKSTSQGLIQAQVESAGVTASTDAMYQINDYALASVQITDIGQDFRVDPSAQYRISGTVEFEGVYAEGKNAERLHSVNVRIGDKTYLTGWNKETLSFFVDIPKEDVAALAGQSIKIDFYGPDSIDKADKEGGRHSQWNREAFIVETVADGKKWVKKVANVPIKVKNFTLTGDALSTETLASADDKAAQDAREKLTGATQSTTLYRFTPPETPSTVVKGKVGGVAKAGDTVSLKLGKATHEATVDDQGGFSVAIDNRDFLNNADHTVVATLRTQALTDQLLEVSTQARYVSPQINGGTFVSQHQRFNEKVHGKKVIDHTDPNYNFPYFIDGLYAWDGHGKVPYGGTDVPLVKKYHFVDPEVIKADPTNQNGYRAQGHESMVPNSYVNFRDVHKDTIRKAFDSIAEVINIRFEESDQPFRRGEGTRLYRADFGGKGISARAWPGGDLEWNDFWGGGNGENLFTSYTALHEITHTLEMNHSHRGNKSQPFFDFEDNSEFTFMSYKANYESMSLRTLRMYDWAFLHYRFGVNPNARAGDDVYTFKDYNFYSRDGDRYIWDGGGIDTFDASMENEGVTVNLTPGSWIYRGQSLSQYFAVKERKTYTVADYFGTDDVNGAFFDYNRNASPDKWKYKTISRYVYTEGQAFIGYGTQIENLIGSSHDDVLIGNKADNSILGGAGNDRIEGGEGNDYLDGGAGADTLRGGLGNDTYVIDRSDTVHEQADEGIDTVIVDFNNYTLGDNLENLVLVGNQAKIGRGNALDNTLVASHNSNVLDGGDGNDTLIGGVSVDVLTGGNGRDTFVFNTVLNGQIDIISDFNPTDDRIALSSTIFTALSKGMTNIGDYMHYDASSGALSYDPDGNAPADAIHFATLPTGLRSEDIMYTVV